MGRAAIILLAFSLILGCASKQYRQSTTPNLNEIRTAGAGDEFFRHESQGDNGEAKMSKLTVLSVGPKDVAMQYQEFTRPVVKNGAATGASWTPKPEFDQRYEFKTERGLIKFKDYEFEILGVENGRIRYRRSF